jgi:hypothetical protein
MNQDETGDTGFTGRYQVERPVQNHAEGFSQALQDALEQARREGVIDVGGRYESEVRLSIGIEVTNPPWVPDYRVWIDPKEQP